MREVDSGRDLPDAALAVDGLSGGYGSSVVVRDVTVRIERGEAVALLGPNGAGKTTLLKLISGLLPARSGSVRLGSSDVTGYAAHRRAQLGLCHIPEGRGVFRSLSVRQNLVMQCIPGEEEKGISLAVQTFPILGRRINQRAGTMSGGEQQMLAMVAAYLRSPNLILVDEPSLGLAPLVVESIFEFLRGMAASGTSLLIVDQFVQDTLNVCERAYVMRKGCIVHEGLSSAMRKEDIFIKYLG